MEKIVKLKVSNSQKLFRAYVEFSQPAFQLRKREADVFAQLLYLNNEKKAIIDTVDRFDIIFSTKYRKIILANLDIKDTMLQNCFSELRKKKLIVDNTIPGQYLIYPTDNKIDLTFKLQVNEPVD